MAILDFTNRKSKEEADKLPVPTNKGLRELFDNVDKVVIKDGGVYQGKAMSDKILLTISDSDKIDMLADLMEIDESNTGFYCMCLGTYAIELHKANDVKVAIGFHHGVSIRYDLWNGDAGLAKSQELLKFLAEQGFTNPLEEKLKVEREQEATLVAEKNWFSNAPLCFSKYQEEINNHDENYLDLLMQDLNNEIPDRQQQIIQLLQTFGRTENFWTGYPAYEELPKTILTTFDIKEIIAAYLQSDRNYKTRRGLGRFLCSFDFKSIRKNHIHEIPQEVINDLDKCFESLGYKRGINEIFQLNNQKKKSVSGE